MRPPPGPVLFFLAASSFVGGCVGGGCVGASRTSVDAGNAIYAPFPHHVAPSAETAAFRFAMVHDVIHERYPRHGPEYYAERERLAREKMAVLPTDSEAAFALTDDIAVGLARRGRTDESIALLRDKLKRQQALKLEEHDLYSSYANLGEFLIHGNLRAMLAGDAAARERVEAGRELLRKSMEVNPKAHFDLEVWHVVAVDSLIEASRHPEVIRKCDLIGNRLDETIEIPKGGWNSRYFEDEHGAYGRPYGSDWALSLHFEKQRREYTEGLLDPGRRQEIRRHIRQVGREKAPEGSKDTVRGRRGPFDEPALWLIGDWRQGSGPNPHSALCLGEIMLRVGQRYLAWTCYERASRMAEQFWPTPELQQFLRDHCKARQDAIERSLPADEAAGLRPKLEAELAFGEAYQHDYQAYADEKIRAGANLNDPLFFDEFHAGRPPIASKVGPEEWYAGSIHGGGSSARSGAFFQWGLLTGGACLLLLAIVYRLLCRPGNPLALTAIPPP
ncbi:MAG TPA: hypothetical protein VKE40_10030 [Gemmataceae bacterium]|nr:hypothetical protein [Gemmataceae bacterium]